jgi:hypothetical protein
MMGTSISRRKGETKILPEIGSTRRLRMTLDYEEDYWFLATLARFGYGPTIPREIVENAAVMPLNNINLFRNKDWRANQCKEILTGNTTVMS